MSNNRFNRLSYSSLGDLPMLQLPVEQLDQLLGQYQQEKDTFDQLSAYNFQHLQNESDVELAGKIRNFQKSLVDTAGLAKAGGDALEYRRTFNEAAKKLIKLREPGGAIHALENRVSEFNQAKLDLQKQFAKDKVMDNYEFALSQLDPGDVGYNLDTGTYNKINAPVVQNYIDIKEKTLDAVKAAKPEIQEISRIKGDWVWDEKGTKYNIKDIMNNLLSSPEIQKQLDIEATIKSRNLSNTERDQVIQDANQSSLNNKVTIESHLDHYNSLFEAGDRNSILDLQSKLKDLGYYKGNLDGQSGPLTEEALTMANQELFERANQINLDHKVEDVPSIIKESLYNTYFGFGNSLLPSSYSNKITRANWRARLNTVQSKNMELMSMLHYNQETNIVPIFRSTNTQNLDKLVAENKDLREGLKFEANEILNKLKEQGKVFKNDNLDKVVDKWLDYKRLDDQEYANKYFGGNISAASTELEALKGSDEGLFETIDAYERLNHQINNYEQAVITNRESQIQTSSGKRALDEAYTEVLRIAPDYDFDKFKQEYLSGSDDFKNLFSPRVFRGRVGPAGAGLPVDNSRMDIYNKIVRDRRIKIDDNNEITPVNFDLYGDGEAFKKAEKAFVNVWNAGGFQQILDDKGVPNVFRVNGKEAKGLKGEVTAKIGKRAGNRVITFSQDSEDGIATLSVNLDQIKEEFSTQSLKRAAAEAINNGDTQDAALLADMIYPDGGISYAAKSRIKSHKDGLTGTIWQDGDPKVINNRYSVVDEYKGAKLIIAKTGTGAERYYFVDDELSILPNFEGELDYNIRGLDEGLNLLKYRRLADDPNMEEYIDEIKLRPINLEGDQRVNFLNNILHRYE